MSLPRSHSVLPLHALVVPMVVGIAAVVLGFVVVFNPDKHSGEMDRLGESFFVVVFVSWFYTGAATLYLARALRWAPLAIMESPWDTWVFIYYDHLFKEMLSLPELKEADPVAVFEALRAAGGDKVAATVALLSEPQR